jgi:hypothetical protein
MITLANDLPLMLVRDKEDELGQQRDWTCSTVVSGLLKGALLQIEQLASGSSQGAACLSTRYGQISSVLLRATRQRRALGLTMKTTVPCSMALPRNARGMA